MQRRIDIPFSATPTPSQNKGVRVVYSFRSSHTHRIQRLRRRQAGDRKGRGILTAEAAGSFPYRHQLNNVPDSGLRSEYADSF